MNLIRLLFLISLFSSKGLVLFSQGGSDAEPSDYTTLDKRSVLLNTSCPAFFYKFDYSGTFYTYDTEFQRGSIMFKGVSYRDVPLNLNSHLDELYFMYDSSRIVMLDKSSVYSFEIGGNHFINLSEDYSCEISDFLPGFYRVVWSGSGGVDDAVLLEKVSKEYSEQFDKSSRHNEPESIEREFVRESQLFLLRNKVAYPLDKPYDLCDIFDLTKVDLRRFLQNHKYSSRSNETGCYKVLLDHFCAGD